MTHGPAGREPLRLAVVQGLSYPGDLGGAVVAHLKLAEQGAAAGARVVLFPELSLTGYEPELIDLHRLRIDPDNQALAPLSALARQHQLYLLVGAPVSPADDPGALPEIGVLRIDPSGTVRKVYSKQHLHVGEFGLFSTGSGPGVLDIDGWRLVLALGRDAAIEDHVMAAAEAGADAYLVGAMFLIGAEDRITEQMVSITAHGMWAALAQYCGGTGGGPACGGSGIWRPNGTEAARLALNEGVAVAELAD